MATVDLDALAAELRAAGLECHIEDDSVFADTPKKKNHIQRRWRITSFGHVHAGKIQWGEWVASGTMLLDDWKYLDIIRRHVSPEPSRRAAVDTEAVVVLVEQYGRNIWWMAKSNVDPSESVFREGADKNLAAIRAMLEPHDAARLRETIAKALNESAATYPPAESVTCFNIDTAVDAVIRAIGGER